jgi:hypothetical protein
MLRRSRGRPMRWPVWRAVAHVVARGGPRWPEVARGDPRWPEVARGGPRCGRRRGEPRRGGRGEPRCGGRGEPRCGGRGEPRCGGRGERHGPRWPEVTEGGVDGWSRPRRGRGRLVWLAVWRVVARGAVALGDPWRPVADPWYARQRGAAMTAASQRPGEERARKGPGTAKGSWWRRRRVGSADK